VTATGPNGRRKHEPPKLTPEALTRRGSAEFGPSFMALQEAVRKACGGESRWEAKVVAGIAAVIEFTVGDVAAARALTVNAAEWASDVSDPELELRSYFESLLEDVAPSEMLFPISSVDGVVETIAIQIRGHLLSGTADRLLELGPELVYLALMPYVGDSWARQWAGSISLRSMTTVGGRTVFDAWLSSFERD
jgi:hypothetical protein